jgi:hypothetical protein
MQFDLHGPAARGRLGLLMPVRDGHVLPLHALSADAVLLERVRTGRLRGQVHSVFEHVVNIACADGALCTLASRALDDAPQTVRIDVAACRTLGLRVGDAVLGSGESLRIGESVRIALDAAAPWHCVLPTYPAHTGAAGENVALLRQALAHHTAGLRDAMGPFEQAALRTVAERTQRLANALRAGRQQDAIVHAQALLGLGPGLTPSGDDVLLGLFAVLHLPGSPCAGWLQGGRALLAAAADATNAISLAALQAAAQGRVRASIVRLLHELLHGGGAALQAATARVLAIGSTSGADIAAGLACGLEVQLFHGSQRS